MANDNLPSKFFVDPIHTRPGESLIGTTRSSRQTLKSDHDAHMALATRVTWGTQAKRTLAQAPKREAPRPVWADKSVVVSRRELRIACALGLIGVLCLAVSAFALVLHCR